MHINEAEMAEYCRIKALFVQQIAMRREACQDADAHSAECQQTKREEGKNHRNEIKQLKKELQRKGKAPA
ncbi:transposase [Glaciimonas immobilis]|uniref:Uncharacterized protein n=1 Tax=Glaciimonas immobilis TaxID=728004 RepID=A0A840RP01_9BURK|nr:transposase [Glaciimonas immobilis]KAF3999262.1 transposase [Glaciimonas immobilis]MBB5198726.1 hypothetical protein [Glaciimonas immobilis]